MFSDGIKDAVTQSPELASQWRDIQDEWKGTEEVVGQELIPVIAQVFEIIENNMPTIDTLIEGLIPLLNIVVTAFGYVATAITDVVHAAQALGFALGGDTTDAMNTLVGSAGGVNSAIFGIGTQSTSTKDQLIALGEQGSQGMTKLSSSAADSALTIQRSMEQIRGQMADAFSGLTGNVGDSSQQEANAIVAEQQKIADLKSQISKATNADTRANLEDELTKEEAAYSKYATLRTDLSSQMAEAERRANETAFERQIEDIQAREVQQVDAYVKQITRLQGEMDFEAAKAAAAQKNEKAITTTVDTETKSQTALVGTQVALQINKYNQLRAAADAAYSAGGSMTLGSSGVLGALRVTSVHDAVITPSGIIQTDPADYLFATKNPDSLRGGGGIVVNIGNLFGTNQSAARYFGDMLAKEINQNLKLRST